MHEIYSFILNNLHKMLLQYKIIMIPNISYIQYKLLQI